MRHPAGIVVHRGRNEQELRVVRRRLVDDLLPSPESHQDVHFHVVVALGHRRELGAILHGEDVPRDDPLHLLGGCLRRLVLTQEHAGEHQQVDVVAPRGDIEVYR
jgi:hypothetical protein